MNRLMDAFDTPLEALPRTVPVFPLRGVTLLPSVQLPLNVFEPRYLNMVNDALAAMRVVGVVQPASNNADPRALSAMGCAGRIASFSETRDGRFLIVLVGVRRFHVVEEIASIRGYRRVVVDWDPSGADHAESKTALAARSLGAVLERFGRAHGLQFEGDALEQMSPPELINFLSVTLPLDPGAKQALVEAPDAEHRAKQLRAMLEAATHGGDASPRARH